MATTMPEHWLLFIAWRGGRAHRRSLIAIDPTRQAAFGRYWGATEHVPCLHFDACYYQPLAWCIAHGYQRFEGGAQGEHKMARGLLPVQTRSAHWLAASAVRRRGRRLPARARAPGSSATSTSSTNAARSRRRRRRSKRRSG